MSECGLRSLEQPRGSCQIPLYRHDAFRAAQDAGPAAVVDRRDDVGDLLDCGRVHITKGDCDMDRPTLNYFEAKGIEL